jgi:hypothetical protein
LGFPLRGNLKATEPLKERKKERKEERENEKNFIYPAHRHTFT